MSNEEYRSGVGALFTCPTCGEELFVFLSADGGTPEVIRRRDIPPESDEGESDDDDTSDKSGAHLAPEPE